MSRKLQRGQKRFGINQPADFPHARLSEDNECPSGDIELAVQREAVTSGHGCAGCAGCGVRLVRRVRWVRRVCRVRWVRRVRSIG